MTLPDDPIQGRATYEDALAAFEALPPRADPVRQRRRRLEPGAPVPGFEQSFARFPLPGTKARSWYLAGGGALADAKPATRRAGRVHLDPTARPPTSFTGNTGSGQGGLWTATPDYQLAPEPDGHGRVLDRPRR